MAENERPPVSLMDRDNMGLDDEDLEEIEIVEEFEAGE